MSRASIRQRVEAATEGPWRHYFARALRAGMGGGPVNEVYSGDKVVAGWQGFDGRRNNERRGRTRADAAFIAAARQDVPLLLAVADAAALVVESEDASPIDRRDVFSAWKSLRAALAALEAQP